MKQSNLFLFLFMGALLASCNNSSASTSSKPSNSNVDTSISENDEKVFKAAGDYTPMGATEATHAEFMVTLNDDGTLLLTSNEIETLETSGHWTLVANKGYKVYFEDRFNTYCYGSYSSSTKDHSFNYNLELGIGSFVDITFKMHDEGFASTYDGIGIEGKPIVFTSTGWCHDNTLLTSYLWCYEDGTAMTFSYFNVPIMVMKRTATYNYDKVNHQFSFTFNDEPMDNALSYDEATGKDAGKKCYRHYLGPNDVYETYPCDEEIPVFTKNVTSTYNQETKTYTIDYTAICCSYVDWTGTFVGE